MRKIAVGDFRISEEEKRAIFEVLDQGRLSEGRKVAQFEQIFAEYIGTRYAVALSSGTAAIMAGLSALVHHDKYRVSRGSKIITTPLTYIATVNAIVQTGFEPVFVDIDPETFHITPEAVEELLKNTPNPDHFSVLLPVHLMGYPCAMDRLNKIAERYNLVVVEDSAQAHGSIYQGKRTGSWSSFGAFSFYIAHNIQAGEMGAITTDDPEIRRLVMKIKANGRLCDCPVCTRSKGYCPKEPTDEEDHDPRFTHDIIGYNFKTMEFQAALGITQMKKADWIFKRRQENVRYLNERLKKYEEVLRLPLFDERVSYLAYPIVLKQEAPITRYQLRHELEQLGVETRPLFGSIPTQQPAYSFLKEEYQGKLPTADFVGKNGFYIGCHQYLNQEDLDYIVEAFEKILG